MKLLVIKITLVWGIVADIIEAVRMAMPKVYIATSKLQVVAREEFGFGLLHAAPLMVGWALVLAWALARPVRRIGVLVCLVPVVGCSMAVTLYGMRAGYLPQALPEMVLQGVLLVLCVVSYFFGRQLKKQAAIN